MLRRSIIEAGHGASMWGNRVALAISGFAGRLAFVGLHTAWFIFWIGGFGVVPDHFPFPFLTLVVSLEAIYLSAFILIATRRAEDAAAAREEAEAERLNEILAGLLATMKAVVAVVEAVKHGMEEQDVILEEVREAVAEHEDV